jgi:geranylgeranyl pyrophosphate synthase
MSPPFDGDIDAWLNRCRSRVNAALSAQIGTLQSEYSDADTRPWLQRLFEAMEYSLLIGGKRVRPALVYAAAQAVSDRASNETLDTIACAVEFIHTYSLVHDDLPAMDDDDLRRGSPTCHKKFDEATAILAGDGLQTRAFELLAELHTVDANIRVQLIATLAAASGPRGMVGGQAIDLGAVQQKIDPDHLETMHRLKTGALIRASAKLGAMVAGATAEQLAAIDRYSAAIGLAFQVQDDILDITADTTTLGKQQGADMARDKPTYPALLGLDGARAKAQALHDEAIGALAIFGETADPLRQLSRYIIERGH